MLNQLLVDEYGRKARILINRIEVISKHSKFRRFLTTPFKYTFAIVFREVVYKIFKKEIKVKASTFHGERMNILLPSSTDIYITGGKSHISEVRLSKYLINNLKAGDVFYDVGAHYGFFSNLAYHLVQPNGYVLSFEPSSKSFTILSENQGNRENWSCYNVALSNTIGESTLLEYPNMYSEYNSLISDQHNEEDWYSEYAPKKTKVATEMLQTFVEDKKPTIIKIDVEGAESIVLEGMQEYLKLNKPIIITEVLFKNGTMDASYEKVFQQLKKFSYIPKLINDEGELADFENTTEYIHDSENVVFVSEV